MPWGYILGICAFAAWLFYMLVVAFTVVKRDAKTWWTEGHVLFRLLWPPRSAFKDANDPEFSHVLWVGTVAFTILVVVVLAIGYVIWGFGDFPHP